MIEDITKGKMVQHLLKEKKYESFYILRETNQERSEQATFTITRCNRVENILKGVKDKVIYMSTKLSCHIIANEGFKKADDYQMCHMCGSQLIGLFKGNMIYRDCFSLMEYILITDGKI